MGEIPEKSVFRQEGMVSSLRPYFQLTQVISWIFAFWIIARFSGCPCRWYETISKYDDWIFEYIRNRRRVHANNEVIIRTGKNSASTPFSPNPKFLNEPIVKSFSGTKLLTVHSTRFFLDGSANLLCLSMEFYLDAIWYSAKWKIEFYYFSKAKFEKYVKK